MKHERILIEKGFLIKPALEVHTIPLKGFRKKKLLRKAMEILKKTDIDYWYLDEKNWNLIIRADPKTAKVVREKLMAKR